MGLIFKGNPPIFIGNVKIEVPTPVYSGKKSSNADDSINPYTGDGPGEGGDGLTEDEIEDERSGGVAGPGSDTFEYTGADQTWNRPNGVTSVTVKIWSGAAGGADWDSDYEGGAGGYTSGTINVSSHSTLSIKVGGGGFTELFTGLQGAGWEDGGDGNNDDYGQWGANGGGGGGRSAIRNGANDTEIICAGGGGGAGALSDGYQGNDAAGTNGISFQGSDGGADGGGGGGGYTGGLGGALNSAGRGGSGYIGHADVSGGTIQAGNGKSATAPQSGDDDYVAGVAVGAPNAQSGGGDGLIVITWT